jgi:Type II secretion system (T2SS), protein E, N-terminal domain
MPLLGDGTKSPTLNRNATPARSSGLGRLGGWEIGEGLAYVPERNPGTRAHRAAGLAGLFSTCANPACASGWLHLWRSRSVPVFEGGWSCSASCTAARIEAAVRRELGGRREQEVSNREPVKHRHRVPLGLVMLEQGWIGPEQLRQALEAQKGARQGKLGQWLVRQQGVPEQFVTRALGLQWSCPVLTLDNHDPEAVGSALPRLFVEAFGALPLRVAAGTILYLGFEDRLDPVVALAAERMLGLRVEAGLVRDSLFESAHQRMLNGGFPATQLMETSSELPIIRVLARAVERVKPVESRLVRLHDCLWLRMWSRTQAGPLPEMTGVEDVICSLIAS